MNFIHAEINVEIDKQLFFIPLLFLLDMYILTIMSLTSSSHNNKHNDYWTNVNFTFIDILSLEIYKKLFALIFSCPFQIIGI